MKTKNLFYALFTLAIFATALHSCKPGTNNCDNCESELITTLQLTLADSATGAVTNFYFRDLDGDGSNAPVQFDTIKLLAGHTYNASLTVLDESKNPVENIGEEIAEEANDHQFFYQVHDISATFVYEDQDSNIPPLPLGLLTKWYIGSATGTGKVHITLKHQPGIKDGNAATGDTDVDVEFNAVVQ